MDVLHLDMPRSLSFSVKPYDFLSASLLHESGQHRFRQFDLNSWFWHHALSVDDRSLVDLVYQFHNHQPGYNLFLLDRLDRRLRQLSAQTAVSMTPYGPQFPEPVKFSSLELADFVDGGPFYDWFSGFIDSLESLSAKIAEADIISLGVDSANGLVMSACLAKYLKARFPDKHVSLTRHEYENYSLSSCVHDIVENNAFFEVFDSLAIDSEKRAETLVALCDHLSSGVPELLSNIAIRCEDRIKQVPANRGLDLADIHAGSVSFTEGEYFQDVHMPVSRVSYLMSIMGNTCYYGKCSFCVQNNKYQNNELRKESFLLDGCLDRIDALIRHQGISTINFLDQAVSPSTLKVFCRKVIERGLQFDWYVRMLLHTRFDDELIGLMCEAGCREVLFGMESVNPETLATMRKAKNGFDDEARIELFSRLQEHGIDICLNVITDYPTETHEAFSVTTGRFVARCRQALDNITYVINRFSLFRDAEMQRSPLAFNLARVLSNPDYDMQVEFGYIDGYGRDSREDSSFYWEAHTRIAPVYEGNVRAILPSGLYFWLNMLKDTSIALYYRRQTGSFLLDDCAIAYARDKAHRNYLSLYPQDFRASEDTHLIIGANSYLGQNLVSAYPRKGLVMATRSQANERLEARHDPLIQVDISRELLPLLGIAPHTVDVISRPVSDDFEVNQAFYTNLKSLIHTYSKRGHLKNLRFYSTQLVYPTPEGGARIPSSEATAPEQVYEYFKEEFEGFLRFICRRYGVNAEVFRLPLLYGGDITSQQKRRQLIYRWMNDHRNERVWSFPTTEQERYGNSWLSVDDFTQWLASRGVSRGYNLVNVSSGDFTYAELSRCLVSMFWKDGMTPPKARDTDYPQSTFFLENETEIRRRSLVDELHRQTALLS
ncbi:radical SAM protein [Marinobacter lipolyticus]|uniref:radical SAM protein n=1 Tax=Marinobacter lipolyticus TaxID=209639 RepID=UPI003A94BFC2